MFRVNAMHIDIVIFNRYNHGVTWATRHFISLISIRKKYESTFKEISKLHLLVVIYECTSGQRKHRAPIEHVRHINTSWPYYSEIGLLYIDR